MVLFDNHNHSQFSFDGGRTTVEKSARAAACAGLGGICFSDHCDFYVPPMKADFEDLRPEHFNVSEQQAEIDRVQNIMGPEIKILKGIEIGMYEECHEPIRRILEENTFDQVLASVHYIDQTDPYYGGYYEGKDWKEAYGRYLEAIYREMTWLRDFDIMGHYDYIVRYASYPQTSIRYRDFSDIFDEMFRYLYSGALFVSLFASDPRVRGLADQASRGAGDHCGALCLLCQHPRRDLFLLHPASVLG